MDVNEKSDHHDCSVCQKHAILVCEVCKGLPDEAGDLMGVYYCGAACQKEDWPSHKIKCKAVRAARDRQILYRAGEIAQALWMLYCRKTWDSVIDSVKKMDYGEFEWSDLGIVYTGQIWQIHPGDRAAETRDYFLPFPVEKFPSVQQQEALLTQSRYRRALYVVPEILKGLLE
ncbi:MAG: hypothetical protein Q9174_003973, partial [Haloplaca sp. 1 TL-2023]